MPRVSVYGKTHPFVRESVSVQEGFEITVPPGGVVASFSTEQSGFLFRVERVFVLTVPCEISISLTRRKIFGEGVEQSPFMPAEWFASDGGVLGREWFCRIDHGQKFTLAAKSLQHSFHCTVSGVIVLKVAR